MILNLAEVDYINSSGLTVLISCSRGTRGKGGDVKLLRPSKRVRDILEITRLNTVLQAFDALELAQVSFGLKIHSSPISSYPYFLWLTRPDAVDSREARYFCDPKPALLPNRSCADMGQRVSLTGSVVFDV